MIALLTTVFVVSLLGSLHCAGMCGGIVLMCVQADQPADGRTARLAITPHLAYHAGRALSYTLLGVVAGTLGVALDLGGGAVGFGRTAAVIAGTAMIGFGLIAILRHMGVRVGGGRLPHWIAAPFQKAYRFAFTLPVVVRAGVIGLLTACLPCGWLYAFVLAAAGTASPIVGGLVMLVFWAGTVPILLGLGLGAQRLTAPLRRHAPTMTAVALMIIGGLTITNRMTIAAPTTPLAEHDDAPPEDVQSFVTTIDNDVPPCCR